AISLTPYLDAAFKTENNVTSNSPGDENTDDFVFGALDLNSNGVKFFFDKSKGAFRAGQASDNSWNDANIGSFSFASGLNTIASGSSSVAFGVGSQASGSSSFAAGLANQANGLYAFTGGRLNTVNADYATAFGYSSLISSTAPRAVALGNLHQISGYGGAAIGSWLSSRSFSEIVLGHGNTDVAAASNIAWVPTDRLFVLGNGAPLGLTDLTQPPNKSDALVILKNGNTRLHGQLTIDADNVSGAGGAYTFPAQRGSNGQVMITDGAGALSWSTLPLPAFNTAGGVTSNSPGNVDTDDFVFGSTQLADDGNASHRSRMFFDKSKSAFRAGSADGTQWNDSNIGTYSVALGQNTRASASGSVALGRGTVASGSYSMASGYFSSATGNFSFAHGLALASAPISVAIGDAQATSTGAVAIGDNCFSSGANSITLGLYCQATADNSVAIGYSSSATGSSSIALGISANASAHGAIALGDNNATGLRSVAHGDDSWAIGNTSFASGHGMYVRSYGESGIGVYATDINPPFSSNSWQALDRLFVIGNGVSGTMRSDALVILKNGNTTINGNLTLDADNAGAGGSYTFPGQRGVNGQVMVTNGAGVLSWSTLALPAFNTVAGVTSNSPGSFAADNLVFGSPSLDNDGDVNHNNRIFFDKSKGAFRAGTTDGTEWDNGERGTNSIAMGNGSIARGDHSLSLGLHNLAHAASTVAIGTNVQAEAYNSVAIGRNVTATGAHSMALGFYSAARSFGETVLGINATDVPATSSTDYNSNDRLLTIGNGQFGAPSDALTILKNGNTTVFGSFTIDADNVGGNPGYTLPHQDGTAGTFLTTDGSGSTQWTNSVPFLTVTNTFTNLSDQRLKRNIRPLQNVMSKLENIHGYNYQWNAASRQDTLSLQTGVIAQELEAVLPELVHVNEEGIKTVNYIGLIPHLIEAVKELKKENEQLRQTNSATKKEAEEKFSAFEERLRQLEGNQHMNANAGSSKNNHD
ncbi:MAG TPA: tail fiber domain-containing protein, partial [Chryseosolibacter sp.]